METIFLLSTTILPLLLLFGIKIAEIVAKKEN